MRILFALFLLFASAQVIKQGSKWNYGPWGGICTAKYTKKGDLWMHKDGVKSTKGTRIWKLNAAGSKKLQAKNNIVKLLWDNRAKLSAFMPNNNQVYVAHGTRYYVFQRVGTAGACKKHNLRKYVHKSVHRRVVGKLHAHYRKHIRKTRANYRKHIRKTRANYRRSHRRLSAHHRAIYKRLRANYLKRVNNLKRHYRSASNRLRKRYVRMIQLYKKRLLHCRSGRRFLRRCHSIRRRLRGAKFRVGVSKTSGTHPTPWSWSKNGLAMSALPHWTARYKCVKGKPRRIAVHLVMRKSKAVDKFQVQFNRNYSVLKAYKNGRLYRYGRRLK